MPHEPLSFVDERAIPAGPILVAKQHELSGEIIRRYATFAAEIIPFQFDVPWPYKKRVKGIRPDPMSNVDFRHIYLA